MEDGIRAGKPSGIRTTFFCTIRILRYSTKWKKLNKFKCPENNFLIKYSKKSLRTFADRGRLRTLKINFKCSCVDSRCITRLACDGKVQAEQSAALVWTDFNRGMSCVAKQLISSLLFMASNILSSLFDRKRSRLTISLI